VLTAGYVTSTGVYAEGGLSNGVPLGAEEDVALALGWEFSLGGEEFARLAFGVSDTGSRRGCTSSKWTRTVG
jgi:hypothetical protein